VSAVLQAALRCRDVPGFGRVGLAASQSPRKGGILDDIEGWLDNRDANVEPIDAAASQASGGPDARSWLDRSLVAKTAGGGIAGLAGNVAGVGRGAWHSVEGLGRGALFLSRLVDPYDPITSGPGDSARDQLLNAGKSVFDYAKNGIANPASVVADVKNAARKLYVDTDPRATPMANTFGGEMARNFNVGSNQGELGWDVGTSLLGSGLAPKALRLLDVAGEAGGSARFVGQGFTPAKADYLALPYKGMGHHLVPRNAWKPIRLPQPLSDSSFNVLKPPGMSRGDFYELHYAVDPRFYTARLPRAVGGGVWNGKTLTLPRYGPVSRVLYGSPAPLKAAVGAAGASGAAADAFNGDR